MDIWSPEQEKERLKARIDGLKESRVVIKEWAARFDIPGGASMISQHISGNRPISMDAGVAYALAFGVCLADISPRLAVKIAPLPECRSNAVNENEAVYGRFSVVGSKTQNLSSALHMIAKQIDEACNDEQRHDVGEKLRVMAIAPDSKKAINAVVTAIECCQAPAMANGTK